MLPGMVNAHSHAFQRVIRGRTEYRGARASDSFWTWREEMYAAAERLTPEDIYDASRMAFMEMALGGITSVGEFHYLHRSPEGREYDGPEPARPGGRPRGARRRRASRAAARRIRARRLPQGGRFAAAPLHRARPRDLPPPRRLPRARPRRAGRSSRRTRGPASRRTACAPCPVEYLREVSAYARAAGVPLHMHVAEQPAEVEACLAEHGRTPVALLADEGVLGPNFTGVHAVHVTAEEVARLRDAGSCVCACPTTERNLGDGVVPADALLRRGRARRARHRQPHADRPARRRARAGVSSAPDFAPTQRPRADRRGSRRREPW